MFQLAPASLKTCIALLLAMLAAAALAVAATPHLQAVGQAPDLSTTVPTSFGEWRLVETGATQISVSQGVETAFDQPYDQTLMRTYANGRGDTVMLALAWGQRQRQDVKVHRPEVCYPAQGMPVIWLRGGAPIPVAGRSAPVPSFSMLAGKDGQLEAVRYWIRIGDDYRGDGWGARWTIFRQGLQGRVVDGVLVRASQRIRSQDQVAQANTTMAGFLHDLTVAVPQGTLPMLVR